MDLSNSFYYFFSATPQVLGAILGLFGVLVIFKTQSAKSNLIGFGQSVLDVIKYEINRNQVLINGVLNSNVTRAIKISVYMQDIEGIGRNIQSIELKHETIDRIKEAFSQEKRMMQGLISSTITMSITTVVLIATCLILLPFGDLILNSPFVTIFVFSVVIIMVLYNLHDFVLLLKIALESWTVM